MTTKEIAVKKYVVKLTAEERQRLAALIQTGKHAARQLTKARILLQADVSELGEGCSDSQIAAALDTSIDTVARTRQQRVEEGFASVLLRKHSPASARKRIFDGAAEAKLIALACSEPPKGYARWTLRLLEESVVELYIVERDLRRQHLGRHRIALAVKPGPRLRAVIAGCSQVISQWHRSGTHGCDSGWSRNQLNGKGARLICGERGCQHAARRGRRSDQLLLTVHFTRRGDKRSELHADVRLRFAFEFNQTHDHFVGLFRFLQR